MTVAELSLHTDPPGAFGTTGELAQEDGLAGTADPGQRPVRMGRVRFVQEALELGEQRVTPREVWRGDAVPFLPRLYLRYLVGSEARAADEDAPRVLRAMVNRASAGGTYPDLFTAAAEVVRHRWVRSDFEEATARHYANEPLREALLELRRRQASRNLRLVYDALAVAVRTQQAASAAGEVLTSLGEAARANRSIARAAAAESRGLRLQAAILAVVIPGLFLYLSAVNPELIAPAISTALGQFVLLPAGVLLEVTGIVLSWRITRLEA